MEENDVLVLDQETIDKMVDDAHRYVYNLLGYEGEYTPENFAKAVAEYDNADTFSVFKPLDMQTDLVTLTRGYGNFGKDFIKALIDNDKASAYHVFEAVTQDWLDLQEFVREVTDRLDAANTKLKSMKETSDTNEEENS